MVATVNNQINTQMGISGESHISEADLAPLKGSLAARKRFLDSFTVHDSLPLSGKITFYNNEGKLVEKDTTMTMRILNVRKLKGDAKYNGVTAVLYGYNPKYEVVVPHVVMSYEPTPVAKTQTIPQGGGHGAQQVQGSQQGSGATKVGGLTPGQFLTDPNSGTTYVVIADQGGNPSLVPVNAMVPAGMQAIAQTTPQGGGQGAQATTATASNNDPNDPKFWYREEHSLDGSVVRFQRDPNTLAWVRVQDPNKKRLEPMEVDPNTVLVNQQTGEIMRHDRRTLRLLTNRGYGISPNPDSDHMPTDVSAITARMSNGNAPMGWWGGQMMPCPGPGFILSGGFWVRRTPGYTGHPANDPMFGQRAVGYTGFQIYPR